MSNPATINVNTREEIAFRIYMEIAKAEGKAVTWKGTTGEIPSREWILNAYVDAINAVAGIRPSGTERS